jgi:potassium-transporting ATPase KdpC subunit
MAKKQDNKLHKGPVLQGLVRPVLVSSAVFMLVTGIGYPMLTTAVARLLFPVQAQGSLVERNGQVIGSAVIGQDFTKPEYFHPRPSATSGTDPNDSTKTVDQPYNAAASAASNQGPTSKKLIDQVSERLQAYRADNGLDANARVPADAVTASGSGLDPDISLANALLQAARIAKARGISADQISGLIDRQTAPRQLGLLGEPRLNVLELNLALDTLTRKSAAR